MTEESDKKGFGGLSSLVSEVEAEVVPKKPTSQTAAPKPEMGKGSGASNEKASTETAAQKPKPPSQPRTADQLPPPPPKGSSAAKWFWSIVGIGILVALFNSGQDDRHSSGDRSTYPTSSAPSTYTPPAWSDPYESTGGTTTINTPRTKVPNLEFTKPPVGTNNVLTVGQIRWCLREDIRIESLRVYTNTQKEVDAFNALVSDYNRRCGSFRYHSGTLERAKREVEGIRSQIVAEALGQSATSKRNSSGQGVVRSELTQEVQSLLKQLGYNPGPVDGMYGGKTKAAIEQFERDLGRYPQGIVSEEIKRLLSDRLRRSSNVNQPRGGGSVNQKPAFNITSSETIAIENTCSGTKLVSGLSAYNKCVQSQIDELSRLSRRPDLRAVNSSERMAIENTCSGTKLVSGPAAYYKCVNGQLSELQRIGRKPDLSSVSSSERTAIENTCSGTKLVSGPAAYYRCLDNQITELRRVNGKPDLSRVTANERTAIENTCSGAKLVSGPAAFYRCLESQVRELDMISRPSFEGISVSDRRAIENSCSGTKLVSGPAAYYRCVGQQLATLH